MTLFELSSAREKTCHKALSLLSGKDETHISFPFFTTDEIEALKADTDSLCFRQATPVVGNQVHQDMQVCFPAPLVGHFKACAKLIETSVNQWSQRQRFLPEMYKINDFAVQKYGKESKGIGIHKDGLRYKYLVMIITLDGESRLFHCPTRDGSRRFAIDDSPGRLVILNGPDFVGFDAHNRLLHGVDQVVSGRLSIGFRHEVVVQTN